MVGRSVCSLLVIQSTCECSLVMCTERSGLRATTPNRYVWMRRTTTTRRNNQQCSWRSTSRMSARHKTQTGSWGDRSCLLHAAEDIHARSHVQTHIYRNIYGYMLFAFEIHIFTLCSNVCIIRRWVDTMGRRAAGSLCTGDDATVETGWSSESENTSWRVFTL